MGARLSDYDVAALYLWHDDLVARGVECISNIRARYDGERRNPWDEAECGSHYARAMASWSALLAISGFRYHGRTHEVTVLPRLAAAGFRSTGTGWGTFCFGEGGRPLRIRVLSGSLPCGVLVIPGASRGAPITSVHLEDRVLPYTEEQHGTVRRVTLRDAVPIAEGQELVVS